MQVELELQNAIEAAEEILRESERRQWRKHNFGKCKR